MAEVMTLLLLQRCCCYNVDYDYDVDDDYSVAVMVTIVMVILLNAIEMLITITMLMFRASRWMGPVSVAVYSPGEDFKAALDIIFHIR